MDTHRKLWNQGHQNLRRALSAGDHDTAIELFLDQHAMVHAGKMSGTGLWSFEDEVLNDLSDTQIRCIPHADEHSIVWILFHLARIEDITMNRLVAGTPQIFLRDHWAKELNISVIHSANQMDDRSVATLSTEIDVKALRAYRQAVGRRTRQIVGKIKPDEFGNKVDGPRLQTIATEGALLPDAMGLLNYWGGKTIGGLLLMPPTRHNFLHLNEAARIRAKLQRQK